MGAASGAEFERVAAVRPRSSRFARTWWERACRLLLVLGPIAVAIGLWELGVSLSGSRLVPAPSAVADAGYELARTGDLWVHVAVSARRAMLGFFVGSSAGVVVGLAMGRLQAFRLSLEPFLQLLRPIPAIAWVPFSILWFGVGESPKVFVIAIGVFFPVWLNTYLGARGMERTYLEAAQTFGVTGLEQFRRVVLPATLPHIVAGLRVGLSLAFILLVAAELTGTSSGMGALVSQSHLVFRTDLMVVGMVLLGATGAFADYLFSRLIRRLVYWE